jgi:diguanylate cyclase (GGDEF)-like protein
MNTPPLHTDENLEEKLNRVQRELTVLYEVSNAMRTTLELNQILYIILTGVTAHTGLGFNRAVLFLVDEKEQFLIPKMAIGPESGEDAHKIWGFISDANQHFNDLIDLSKMGEPKRESNLFSSIKNLRVSLKGRAKNKNLLLEAAILGAPLHIKEEQFKDYENDELLKRFKTNELVIMPLKAKDKIKGLIVADNIFTKKPITINDLKIFQMLANQAGLAIENSHLYEIVIEKSHTDSLTGLWNHGFFQSKIHDKLEEAKKKSFPLSLMMIDIDNFKILNDKYGHQYGDEILKVISNIIKGCSRDIDYCCRYGGEELCMILSQTEKHISHQIAERVRKKIDEHQFPSPSQKENAHITVSIGIATYPEDAQLKENLIAQADKAMYKAKFSGKNQTCGA